ncbi:DUF2867 domain-containing protein [Vibrio sp. SCSIO 43132]|uniref:DUF2867 domain-containing protein n=1 Tax=Vibrio sp. SCSIO 43132 TaxID=2779363 RepID=UPI001CA82DBB|nr:DUF2867 domain-containing protein [Vibrio sp. SCSIO 43132]UAB69417.1 DUF2867 domain-containing protein [Vibrio sp. SCSIO 43132]
MTFQSDARIHQFASESYFRDTFTTLIENRGESAMEVYLRLVSTTPSWVNQLMDARNRIVGLFGLKNLGRLTDVLPNKTANEYQAGDMVGIFSLHSISDREVIMEDDDKHLNVKVSLFLEDKGEYTKVYATTTVHVYNMLGRAYMFFVTPAHKVIVPASLRNL